MTTRAVAELKTAGIPVRTGCALLGVPRATYYRIAKGYNHYRPVAAPVPHRDRAQPAALSEEESRVLLDILTDTEHADLSVGQLYWTALDEGSLACSESTFYRVARRHRLVKDRRRAKGRTGGGQASRRTPVVDADKPGDLWSWDITDLKGPGTRDRYKLYLAIDVFSRYPVTWRIEHTEDTAKAVQMFSDAFAAHGAPGCLHADNGPSMRAEAMLDNLDTAGVLASYSRPRVSNDNPFLRVAVQNHQIRPRLPDPFRRHRPRQSLDRRLPPPLRPPPPTLRHRPLHTRVRLRRHRAPGQRTTPENPRRLLRTTPRTIHPTTPITRTPTTHRNQQQTVSDSLTTSV